MRQPATRTGKPPARGRTYKLFGLTLIGIGIRQLLCQKQSSL